MTATPFQYLQFELPEGWEHVDRPVAALFQAVAPVDDGFQSNLVADIYAGFDRAGSSDAHRDFHIAQVESFARTMTDAVLIDDADTVVAGHAAISSTIAFRQGYWTVTALVWTIDAADSVVMVAAFCDVDRLPVDGPALEAVVQSIVIAPNTAESHA